MQDSNNNPGEPRNGPQTILQQTLQGIQTGGLQTYRNMAILPLFSEESIDPAYSLLREVLNTGGLTIQEVDEAGSVGNLTVVNEGAHNVLLVDGEELTGAKQNRVMNASVFVEAGKVLNVPVSCTEQGRWRYRRHDFVDPDFVLCAGIRETKSDSVRQSLKKKMGYVSNQGKVWSEIGQVHACMDVSSATGAMQDAYDAKRNDLEDYKDAFDYEAGQTGLIVYRNGSVCALELFSTPKAYAGFHHKIIGSHAMNSLLSPKAQVPGPDHWDDAVEFLNQIHFATPEAHSSVGRGEDLRFEGTNFHGSALCVDDVVVHAVAFSREA